MLIQQVFEFFCRYVFGGTVNGTTYHGLMLYGITSNGNYISESFATIRSGYSYVSMDGTTRFVSMGNYLSLIATIITTVVIVLFCVFIIKKIIGIIFRLFTGSSSF